MNISKKQRSLLINTLNKNDKILDTTLILVMILVILIIFFSKKSIANILSEPKALYFYYICKNTDIHNRIWKIEFQNYLI